ncbi:exosortase V [Sphingomonas sp. MAH-20]|uniref:Exosortase V n=1 Tax=Sphingomonas horti TaxID=2682842 RepID=A0A6I4IZR9_9SPHN|nr:MULTISPECIES: exosortase V [Sphingomonas]MBA2920731.1 exosortase V [Sphingomonas sp. CGMCC 1.13658]MVO77667.1 exosortase V [Sphingomonas horti]
MATRPVRAHPPASQLLARHWPLLLGLAVLAFPTLYAVATGSWTGEAGVHGPIVLATGIWLFARRWKELLGIQHPGRTGIMLAVLVPSLLLYIFGRAFDFLVFQALAFLGVCIAVFYASFGAEALRRMWFPILYLGFVVPLPNWVITTLTAPMKEYVSYTATWLLSHAGYPIVREGVTLYVAQYQLLVEDACAGLNSLISLTAISLFYIYILHNASWRYALFLMLWIVPVALLANLVRVIILVLITYHFGNAAAQGFLHSTAGLVMFATALLGIFLVDGLMSPIRRMLTRTAA